MAGNSDQSGGFAAAAEQGEVLRVVVQHCREMKRQETCSRWITALLALTIFTGFLWLQASAHCTKDDAGRQPMTDTGVVQALNSVEPTPKHRRGRFIHLLSAEYSDQIVTSQNEGSFAVRWKIPQLPSDFKLEENETCLVIPRKGLYLVSVRMSYRALETKCPCADGVCFLSVLLTMYQNKYPQITNIVVGHETMRCVSGWRQTVILSRVIKFENSTKLRVNIDNQNHELISWDNYNHFEITRL
ncbi:hypothetical protein AMEX_G296 [Astyanax mexicanus]|uniref:THD domain-containing protein n=1 Tax=Astyanax mexicanus TaxID=7994 RepID=A0A8T2MEY1_ASTMX|nr:hypothetical protein AMEX_G296 [Astyanax mexicanus]